MSDKTISYTGEVLNCMKHGHGAYRYPGGDVYSYDGDWDNGQKQSSKAKFVVSGYSEYEGDFQHGEMTGVGKKVWADGRSYIGEWLYGEMHGKGSWISADGSETYEGEYVDNKRCGNGHLKQRNGDTYNGNFDRHKFHGEGVYLRENSFFVSAVFDNGVMNGKCSVKWHKLASYDGNCTKGAFEGQGHYVVLDGSFEYDGSFASGVPAIAVDSIGVTLDRSKCPEDTDGGKKDKKKKPAAKKGAVEVEPVGAVPAGKELGKLIVSLQYKKENSEEDETAPVDETPKEEVTASSKVKITNSSELRRQMKVRLRPYIPPAPPAKGVAPEPPNPLAEMGDPVALWRRPLSLEELTTQWERFPLQSLRYVNGVNPLTGESVQLEGGATDFSATSVIVPRATAQADQSKLDNDSGEIQSDEQSHLVEEKESVLSAVVTADRGSCVSISFTPSRLEGASEQMSFVADWKLAEAFHSPSAAEALDALGVCDIDGVSYSHVSVLTLSHVVGGLEGAGRLDLLLLTPKVAPTDDHTSLVGAVWKNCVWELRLTETKKDEEKDFIMPASLDEEKPTVTVEDAKEEIQTEEKLDESPPVKVNTTEHVTVLCRWADSSEFDASSWHSVALTLSMTPDDNNSAADSAACSSSMSSLVSLTVDGSGRMKREAQAAFEEGIASAWLPEKLPVKESTITDEQPAGLEDAKTAESEPLPQETEKDESNGEVGMIFRVGYGAGFQGHVKNLAVCTKADRCDLQSLTACFADWTANCHSRKSKSTETESPDPAEEGLPAYCDVVYDVSMLLVGGRGVLEGVLIPNDTPAGTYVVEVYDAVNGECLQIESEDPATDDVVRLVDDMDSFCRLVPTAGSSMSTHKLTVE